MGILPENRCEVVRTNENNYNCDVLEEIYDVVSDSTESTVHSFENNSLNLCLRSEVNAIEHYTSSSNTVGNFGNIEIENSKNITFGNKNFFQGPVVIKQLVVDNEKIKVHQNAGDTPEVSGKHI